MVISPRALVKACATLVQSSASIKFPADIKTNLRFLKNPPVLHHPKVEGGKVRVFAF